MISGTENPDEDYDQYIGFDVAHIFPFAREADWRSNNFMRFIRGHTSASLIGSSKIHSPQNGILLSSRIHALFDTFRVSVNPDVRFPLTHNDGTPLTAYHRTIIVSPPFGATRMG
jgi:hypothetical protein